MILNTLFESFYIYVFIYFLIYNLSALTLFWSIISFLPNHNSIFSFKSLNSNIFLKILTSIIILSVAGLPPFLGFFTKIFILNYVIFSQLTFNILSFFILILMMLYFYIQNFKIIFSINNSKESFNLSYSSFSSKFFLLSNYLIIFLVVSPLSIEFIFDLLSNLLI